MIKIDTGDVYNELGIIKDTLGCIMMETESLKISDLVEEDDLYFSQDSGKFWINGIVSEWGTPHITLLWGLMQSGNSWKSYVDQVLEGWTMGDVTIDEVGYFESNHENEPYYCLIAHLELTDKLIEANFRLRHLPHIDNFLDYKPHITLVYIKKDADLRDTLITKLNERFAGKKIKTKELNYGR